MGIYTIVTSPSAFHDELPGLQVMSRAVNATLQANLLRDFLSETNHLEVAVPDFTWNDISALVRTQECRSMPFHRFRVTRAVLQARLVAVPDIIPAISSSIRTTTAIVVRQPAIDFMKEMAPVIGNETISAFAHRMNQQVSPYGEMQYNVDPKKKAANHSALVVFKKPECMVSPTVDPKKVTNSDLVVFKRPECTVSPTLFPSSIVKAEDFAEQSFPELEPGQKTDVLLRKVISQRIHITEGFMCYTEEVVAFTVTAMPDGQLEISGFTRELLEDLDPSHYVFDDYQAPHPSYEPYNPDEEEFGFRDNSGSARDAPVELVMPDLPPEPIPQYIPMPDYDKIDETYNQPAGVVSLDGYRSGSVAPQDEYDDASIDSDASEDSYYSYDIAIDTSFISDSFSPNENSMFSDEQGAAPSKFGSSRPGNNGGNTAPMFGSCGPGGGIFSSSGSCPNY